MKKLVLAVFVVGGLLLAVPGRTEAAPVDNDQQSGCCSHHGGVCGCSAGSKICCDGATSPTCHCAKASNDDAVGDCAQ